MAGRRITRKKRNPGASIRNRFTPGGKRMISDALFTKIAVCAVLFLMVTIVKGLGNGPLAPVKDTLSRYIGSGADYEEAIAVIGRAVTEGDGLAAVMEEEAIKVFGTSLIIPGKTTEAEGKEHNPLENKASDLPQGEDALVIPPHAILPDRPPDPAEHEPGLSSDELEETLWRDEDFENTGNEDNGMYLKETGNTTLFPSIFDLLAVSDPEPYVVEDIEALEALLYLREEVIDNTPATEFPKPTPMVVDDTVYTLPFEYAMPLNGRITSPFGWREHPVTGEFSFHYGMDIAARKGDTVGCFAAGTVTEIGTGVIYGKYVKVLHEDGFYTRYCHLNKISVKKGQKVKLGQKVGEAGNTGVTTGTHLHFEVRRNDVILNPHDYVKLP